MSVVLKVDNFSYSPETLFQQHEPARPTVLCDGEKCFLSRIGQTKKTVVVLVKCGRDFFRNLHGLKEKLPDDAALIAFAPKKTEAIEDEVQECFDLIVFYDDSGNVVKEVNCTDQIQIPLLHVFADELVQLVPKHKLLLIHTEESSCLEMCRVRERLDLRGVRKNDITRITQKERVAERAEKHGVPMAKTVFIDFTMAHRKERILAKITTKITHFPMFAKPSMLMGSIGTSKLNTKEDLEAWITERMNDNNPTSYVVQEFINGREFSVVTVLLQNGSYVPIAVKYLADIGNFESHKTGKPLISCIERYEKANADSFPNIGIFVEKVIETFKPVHPQILIIQGFQEKDGTESYKLGEMNYRPASVRVDTTLYSACGISQITAMLLAFLNADFYPKPERSWKPQILTSIWYFYTDGVLLTHNPLPTKSEIQGKLTADWHIAPGTKLKTASDCDHVTVMLLLESETTEQRDKDLEWIRQNWKPDMTSIC